MSEFPEQSPFYEQVQDTAESVQSDKEKPEEQLELGRHEFTPGTARPVRAAKTSVVDTEDIYHRLDRALALIDSGAQEQGVQDLYDLRDEIYRGLR